MTLQTAILKSPEKILRAQAHWGENLWGMTMPSRKHVPPDARELLDESGVEWTVQSGSRHFKLIIDGKFAAIIPHSKPASRVASRAHRNMLAHIRRAIRRHQ